MTFVQCEQKLSYLRRLRDDMCAYVNVAEADPELKRWFFDMPCANIFLMRSGIHWKLVLVFEICKRTTVRNSVLVGWHNFEMVAVPSKNPLCDRAHLLAKVGGPLQVMLAVAPNVHLIRQCFGQQRSAVLSYAI